MAKRRIKKVERKKLLTLSDLYNFYASKNENLTFSSAETGYKLAVQVPAQFEINKEQNDDSLLFCLVKLMHSGENRNHSSVTDDALIKASKTLAYKPILANFVEYVDPETNETLVDFTSHDMEITEDGITYYEHQIGCFTADESYFEVEEDTGHNFLYGYCAIPRSYTEACSIIERKNGTKVSVELEINEMQYSVKNKVLELTDVTITGATCLGKDAITLNNVEEGMKNARLDIVDFSVENNSVVNYSKTDNTKLIETLEKLNTTLSKFNINTEDSISSKIYGKEEQESMNDEIKVEEEVTEVETVEENVEEVSDIVETEEVVVEDTAEESAEETVEEVTVIEEFTEEVAETETDEAVEEVTPDVGEDANEDGEVDVVEEEIEETETVTVVEEVTVKPEKYSVTMSDGSIKEFALSLDEINNALYMLVNQTYGEADNTYYGVQVFEDGTLIMIDWWNNKAFRQSYTRGEDDNFSLVGDRVAVNQVWVTAEEEEALNEMKANYSSLVQFKADTKNAELHAQREAILYDAKYSVLAEKDENNKYKNEAYAKLVSEMDNYSLTDLEKELKSVFADHITNGGQFAYAGETESKPTITKKLFANSKTKKSSRYGNLFDK